MELSSTNSSTQQHPLSLYTESVPPLQGLPQQQEMMGSGPPLGVREVTIERPNIQTSFGFVLQSNTLRPGCMICEWSDVLCTCGVCTCTCCGIWIMYVVYVWM